jgi:hypothetical protein
MQNYKIANTILVIGCVLLFASHAFGQTATAASVPSSSENKANVPVERTVTVAAPVSEKIASPQASSITLTLPNSVRADVTRIDTSAVKLKAERIVLRADDRIVDLLDATGIKPDADALGLVYDLNPDIDDFRYVTPGTPLILPRVEGNLFFQMATSKGYRVALLRDATMVQTINTQESELKKVRDRIATLEARRFSRPEDKDILIRVVENAAESLEVIGSRRFAVSDRVLKQSTLEAAKLMESLSRTMSAGETFSPTLIAAAQNNGESLQAKSESLKTGGSAQARVEVKTIRNVNGKAEPVPLLRIFYAPELDLKNIGKYRTPSTPTSEALAVGGRFTFWAANTEDGSNRISDTATVTVKKTSNDPVTLLVIK